MVWDSLPSFLAKENKESIYGAGALIVQKESKLTKSKSRVNFQGVKPHSTAMRARFDE